jgi:hypothetical protein
MADAPHLIIGVKLLTLHDAELAPAAGMQWTLHLWKPGNLSPAPDRIIGVGSLLDRTDAEIQPAA